MLEERGAVVIHVPLISIEEPADGGVRLQSELDALDRYDWLVVTSVAGADRVAEAAATARVRLAAVGTSTAERLATVAGREVDLVPSPQRADALADALVELAGDDTWRVLVAQGDLADGTLAARLRTAGHHVTDVVAYRTVARRPELQHRADIVDADALTLASGSAARSWVEAFGAAAPAVVVAIGPATARVAGEIGLKISSVAADHSLEGLVTALEQQLGRLDS